MTNAARWDTDRRLCATFGRRASWRSVCRRWTVNRPDGAIGANQLASCSAGGRGVAIGAIGERRTGSFLNALYGCTGRGQSRSRTGSGAPALAASTPGKLPTTARAPRERPPREMALLVARSLVRGLRARILESAGPSLATSNASPKAL
jgi:hypothetical protein